MLIAIKKTSAIRGFGLIDVLVAMVLIATTLFGIVKLSTSLFRSSDYANNQQQLELAKQFIFERITANLKFANGVKSASHYAESSFAADETSSVSCANGSNCTQDEQALYDLYLWKQYLQSLNINSLRGIVCVDNNTPGIPTLTNPNCNSNGGRIYIKLVWFNHLSNHESNLATLKNYLIVPIVTTTEVAMFSAWSADGGGNVVPPPVPLTQLPVSVGQCYSGNCNNTVISGACNSGGACDSSVIYGACNSQTSCDNSLIYGSCNVAGASCDNSLILGGDCNSSSCSNSFIDGSCNSGGNCWSGNCTNAIIYGSCTGNCTGSIVYGSCWGTGCVNGKSTTTSNTLSQSLTISGSKNNLTISGFPPMEYFGFITVSSITTGQCTNGTTCTSSAIDGQCGNNGTCSGSFINGSCSNNGTCNNSYINGGCSNNGVCNNSIIMGNCGNNASCKDSVIYGKCGNGADCSNATCRNPTTGAQQSC